MGSLGCVELAAEAVVVDSSGTVVVVTVVVVTVVVVTVVVVVSPGRPEVVEVTLLASGRVEL